MLEFSRREVGIVNLLNIFSVIVFEQEGEENVLGKNFMSDKASGK